MTVQRLQTRPQFQAVLSGRTLARTAHFALHFVALPLPADAAAASGQTPLFASAGPFSGAMVPKRWAKRAVTRNTIKRQIYTVSSDYSPHMQAGAHLVRLRASFDRTQFVSATSDALKAAVRAELLQLFAQGLKP